MTESFTIAQGRRYEELIQQLKNHPNRDEIVKLALEQVTDDADSVATCNKTHGV